MPTRCAEIDKHEIAKTRAGRVWPRLKPRAPQTLASLVFVCPGLICEALRGKQMLDSKDRIATDPLNPFSSRSIIKRFDGGRQVRVNQAKHSAAFAQPATDIELGVFVVGVPILGHFLLRWCVEGADHSKSDAA